MILSKYKKFFKVLSINILLLIFGTISIEFFFKLINKEKIFLLNKYGIPKLVCNISSDYDVSHLYNSSKLITSIYQRDEECYRSKNSNNYKLPIILTIGGSTTEQSLPGCNYIDKYNVIDTYGTNYTPNYCRTMGEIYLSLDHAISELSPGYKSKVSIHKMYLENTLKYEDVYNAVHTNNGSRKIAEYIKSLY